MREDIMGLQFATPHTQVKLAITINKKKGQVMTNELILIKKNMFEDVEADIYKDNCNEIYMTARQLAECLGYSSKHGIEMMLSRNEYLKNPEFSKVLTVCECHDLKVDGQLTRVFTEDGIYEVSMLSRTEKAKEFRCWVRKILKAIRNGDINLNNILLPNKIEIQNWKYSTAYILSNRISVVYGVTARTAIDMIYRKMQLDYHFSEYEARKEYQSKYNEGCSTIDAIADDEIYRMQYVESALNLLGQTVPQERKEQLYGKKGN